VAVGAANVELADDTTPFMLLTTAIEYLLHFTTPIEITTRLTIGGAASTVSKLTVWGFEA